MFLLYDITQSQQTNMPNNLIWRINLLAGIHYAYDIFLSAFATICSALSVGSATLRASSVA